ncbi:MAG TPA: carotenoid biosynthesis protein [Ktedonobacterales bacterium]|jgi:putative membrane protein
MRVSRWVLWGLVALFGVLTLINSWLIPHSIPTSVLVLIPVAFALIHGSMRYGWGGILVFVIICLVVSNALENLSILTGFPFGHYHYTDGLGPKLFLVPLLIGPAYISTGYLAWVIGNVLVGDIHRSTGKFTLFATPFIAAFAMVAWDVCLDPTLSTILKFWIWEQGGGYFGVPLSNYLGWFFTVFIFFQLFALYVYFRQPGRVDSTSLPKWYYAQAITTYAITGSQFILNYLSAHNRAVTDATGAVWQTINIYETAAIMGLFTMIFIAALTAVKLAQQRPSRAGAGGAADTSATPLAERVG